MKNATMQDWALDHVLDEFWWHFCWKFLRLYWSTPWKFLSPPFLYKYWAGFQKPVCMSFAFPTIHLSILFIYLFIPPLQKCLSNTFICNFFVLLFIVSILTYPNSYLLNYLATPFAIFCGEIFSFITCANQRVSFTCWSLSFNNYIIFRDKIFGLYEANPCSGSIWNFQSQQYFW